MDYKQYQRYYTRLEPIIKQPEVKAYTVLSLTILTIAVFGFLAVRPGIENIASTYREIKDNKLLYQTLDQKVKDLQKGKENYAQFVEPREKSVLYPALPTRPEFNLLLSKLEKAVTKANVTTLSLQFQPVELSETGNTSVTQTATPSAQTSSTTKKVLKTYTPIEFDMTLTGDYSALNSFLNYLYRLNRIIVVQSIHITKPEKEKNEGQKLGEYNLTIKAQTYYQK